MPLENKVEEQKYLKAGEKQEVQYCIPLWLRDEQIRASIKRIKGRIQPGDKKSESVAVVCFGPSLKDTWEEVKKFKYIISCSGSHKFLLEHGIVPTYHVEVDPRKHKAELIGTPHKDVEYLIASACHSAVFDLLEGYNVKLWHVFDMSDSSRVLPSGEWAITGGCGVGLRAMTIATFLGFKDLHIFGMDGSEGREGEKHAAYHPNESQKHWLVEFPEGSGTFYRTNPGMLEAARSTFHELDQMPTVTAKFYGEGLVQAMAKEYKPKPTGHKMKNVDAFLKPELISAKFVEMNRQLHQDNVMYGTTAKKHVDTVLKMADSIPTRSILDYGCGKGLLGKSLPFPIWEYDPAIEGKEESPRPADFVVCVDVLEHIEPDKLAFVLNDLKRCVLKVGFFTINTRPAIKKYSDGSNVHQIQQGKGWWELKLKKYFDVASIQEYEGGAELYIVVGPKKKEDVGEDGMPITDVEFVRFYTPNSVTAWRAKTLLTKEPVTIEWINGMQAGDVMYDIGANVGGYTVWAGKQGVKVYAFEPEAENYNLLIKNMMLNEIEPNAYCVALSNRPTLGTLNLNKPGAGSSCHLFGVPVEDKVHQGCVGLTLDQLVEMGKLPLPNHIKIDVDGLEYLVIEGASKTLKSSESLLIEVDTNQPVHMDMVSTLVELGFQYDQDQVDKATRKEGTFKGCAEFLFKRKQSSQDIMLKSIKNAPMESDPFPYVYVENVFSDELYKQILDELPDEYESLEKARNTKGYKDRFVANPKSDFWKSIESMLCDGRLMSLLCDKFGIQNEGFTNDIALIRDQNGYQIGPHTDHPKKVFSALFYLPKDESQINAGTSLYVPKQAGFECDKGGHYSLGRFKKVATVPFKPNSLLVFLRSNKSFHGVEKYQGDDWRNVLLYNVRRA